MQTEQAPKVDLPTGCGMCHDRGGWLPVWIDQDEKLTEWGEGGEAAIPCTCARGDFMASNFQPYRFYNQEQRGKFNRARMRAEKLYRAALAKGGHDAPPSNVVQDFDPDDHDFLEIT